MQLLGTQSLDPRHVFLALGGWSLGRPWTDASWPKFECLWKKYLALSKNPVQFSLEVLGPGAGVRPEVIRAFFFRGMTFEIIHRASDMADRASTLTASGFRRELDSLLFLERLWAQDLTARAGLETDMWRERLLGYVALLLMIDQCRSGARRTYITHEVDVEMGVLHHRFARHLPIGSIPAKGLTLVEWRAIKRLLEEIGSYFGDRGRGEHELADVYRRLSTIAQAQRFSIDDLLQR